MKSGRRRQQANEEPASAEWNCVSSVNSKRSEQSLITRQTMTGTASSCCHYRQPATGDPIKIRQDLLSLYMDSCTVNSADLERPTSTTANVVHPPHTWLHKVSVERNRATQRRPLGVLSPSHTWSHPFRSSMKNAWKNEQSIPGILSERALFLFKFLTLAANSQTPRRDEIYTWGDCEIFL